MIDISGVNKRYGDVNALTDVAIAVAPGVTGLLGPNGSGKSTLIKALLGLVKSQSGSGTVLGHPWPAKVRTIRDLVGYLPEDDCYIAGLVGIESVAFMAKLSGLPDTEGLRRAHEIMDFCDIGEERYREVEGYSTGMRQKLKFAQALVHDPPLLILDEPTTGLDPDQRHAMLSRIRTLSRDHGKSIILSTHILPDVQSVCDQVIILAGGIVRVQDKLAVLSELEKPTMHVSVLGDPAPLAAKCESEGMEVSTTDDGSLLIAGLVTIDQGDRTSKLWQWAAETDTSIRRYHRAKKSLEQIFVDAALTDPHVANEASDLSFLQSSTSTSSGPSPDKSVGA
ncbi:ABC transporter ATP-binding protein [Stieleria marina]|uniref:Putative ABC transporter ATP-binding protein YxlF n=1 Tax=Stieleria marina TaxID=1930275 RepID=A0A517NNI3_9BACT|nr:putative ABC transporter ATP-binding protein YxlF [Planctomycetes bacterium K23_9]